MLDRLWVGLADLRGVAWLMRRAKVTDTEEVRIGIPATMSKCAWLARHGNERTQPRSPPEGEPP
jgi:hypothetical protein